MQKCHTAVGHCTGRQQGGAEGVTGGMQDTEGVWVIEENCLTGPVHQYPNMPGSADNMEGHVAPTVAEGEIALIMRQHPGAVVVAQPSPVSRALTIHAGIAHTNLWGR